MSSTPGFRALRAFLIAVLTLPLCLGETPSPPPPVLTLAEAVETALRGNREVQAAVLEIAKAREATAELRTARLPRFDAAILAGVPLNPIRFTIPRGAIGAPAGVGPLPASDASITTGRRLTGLIHASAAQPVLQLYKIGLGVRAARLGEEFARENLRQKRQETAEHVRQAYYQLVQTQAQLAAAEVSFRYLEEFRELIGRRLLEEAVLKSDALSVDARAGEQRYQLVVLRDAIDTQKEALNRLLGRDLRTAFSVEVLPAPDGEELDLDAARGKALASRPEVRKAMLQARKAELDVRRERADYLPSLSLQLSYLSFANIRFAPQNATSAGFLLQWQPFDWGGRRHRLARLRATARQADLAKTEAGQQVQLDVGAAFRKLAEARALLEAKTTVQAAEREKLRVVMQRFGEKAALASDALQQQAALAQADSEFSRAVAAFWTARAAFHRSLGEE